MAYQQLNNQELQLIKGGGEQTRPISRPREEYDDEKAQSAFLMEASQKEEAMDWVEWLKNWLGKKK